MQKLTYQQIHPFAEASASDMNEKILKVDNNSNAYFPKHAISKLFYYTFFKDQLFMQAAFPLTKLLTFSVFWALNNAKHWLTKVEGENELLEKVKTLQKPECQAHVLETSIKMWNRQISTPLRQSIAGTKPI